MAPSSGEPALVGAAVAAAQGQAVTPEQVPAPGQQDTVPPVAADPALQERAGESGPEAAANASEAAPAPPADGSSEAGAATGPQSETTT